MRATCCNCNSDLKYPVIIKGKIYGADCAAKALGIKDIPKGFSGDYDAYKAKKRDREDRAIAKYSKHKAMVDLWIEKYAEDVKRLSVVFFKARDFGNNWEMNFINSIANQADLSILGDTNQWFDTKYKYGHMKIEPKGLKSLSDKQIKILERIELKYS